MIRLASEDLPNKTASALADLQDQVDQQPDHLAKVRKAGSLWKSKNREAFAVVRETLTRMCVSVGVCNYCEQNEATDIEHVYPKSHFPGKAFEWENYLLACKTCNTTYKLDRFAVLDENDDLIEVQRDVEPATQRGAFINPRIEDPSRFLILNFQTFQFEELPGLGKSDRHKAEKTRAFLQLNERALLVHSRRETAKYLYHRMHLLVRIVQAETMKEVVEALSPHEYQIDPNLSLGQNKVAIKENFKKEIQEHKNPSVWIAIKLVQGKIEPKWIRLFEVIPEALDW